MGLQSDILSNPTKGKITGCFGTHFYFHLVGGKKDAEKNNTGF